jgi:hypothetical protein
LSGKKDRAIIDKIAISWYPDNNEFLIISRYSPVYIVIIIHNGKEGPVMVLNMQPGKRFNVDAVRKTYSQYFERVIKTSIDDAVKKFVEQNNTPTITESVSTFANTFIKHITDSSCYKLDNLKCPSLVWL